MSRRRRGARWLAFGLLVAALSVVAAGCGGDDGGSASTDLEGLGSSFEEIQELAREEGEVNIVQWPLYAQLVEEFTAATGCTVTLKDAGTSDDMISFMGTGEYDGIVASGNATVRLMATGEVAPINEDLIPNYADIHDGLKGQVHNSLDGVAMGVPHGRGYNPLAWRTDEVTAAPTSWSAIWDNPNDYKGKISIYDDSIFIADAALYLKATQPELGIDNPYELDEEQFNAAVDLMKQLAPNVGEWWADYAKQIQAFTNKDSVIGTTWPLQVNLLKADGQPVESVKPSEGSTGWSDTWMVSTKAAEPELHVPLDEPHGLAGGAGRRGGGLRRGASQPEGVRPHEEHEPLHRAARRRRGVLGGHLLLDDPGRRLRRRSWGGVQDPGGLGSRLDRDQGLAV